MREFAGERDDLQPARDGGVCAQALGQPVGASGQAVEIGDHEIGGRKLQIAAQRQLGLERPHPQRRRTGQRHRQDRRQRRIGDQDSNGLERLGHG